MTTSELFASAEKVMEKEDLVKVRSEIDVVEEEALEAGRCTPQACLREHLLKASYFP